MLDIEKLYIQHLKSEKTKNEYNALNIDYLDADGEIVTQPVSFDSNVCLVLSDMSNNQFNKALKNVGSEIVLFEKKHKTEQK